ncbi:hypothetical protein COU59_02835 [Candidatus Pacearchaeota archaeon CG10_big_fil_rev_8_21_14_0_10_34_12]|nr:MAG: hypothetical protein COU59_02835 [Candidatus Pacearchaeota archaeon CG10_big_fil_rev_8_21_14_0_10_34_12]
MAQKDKEEYYFLTEKLEEIQWALEGECNDIDCDKYMYRDLLKKKYKPVLKHSYSCIDKLKKEKEIVLRLLFPKKFRKYRFEKCYVCKKPLDKLDDKSIILSFTRPSKDNKNSHEWKGYWIHKKCKSKAKIPKGWIKF